MNTEAYIPTPYGGKPSPYNLGSAEISDAEVALSPRDDFELTFPIDPIQPSLPATTGGSALVVSGRSSSTKTIAVEDTDTGEPIPNVNVYVKGFMSNGSITDANGNVTLTANPDDTVVFSHVSYGARERRFGDLGGLQNLDKQSEALDNVTVTAPKKTNKWLLIGGGLALLWGISTVGSKGKKGKTGLNGGKSKGRKKSKRVTI